MTPSEDSLKEKLYFRMKGALHKFYNANIEFQGEWTFQKFLEELFQSHIMQSCNLRKSINERFGLKDIWVGRMSKANEEIGRFFTFA